MKRLLLLLVLALAPLALAANARASGTVPVASAPLEKAEYIGAIDGDTIIVKAAGDTVHVRLFGINAAELHSHTALAFAAAARTATDLEGAGAVYLQHDPAALGDKYGRMLAWVWYLPRATLACPQPQLVNLSLELHSAGLAEVYLGKHSVSNFYAKQLALPVEPPPAVASSADPVTVLAVPPYTPAAPLVRDPAQPKPASP